MDRELPRTLYSLQPPYQQNVHEKDIEIVLVDNGSTSRPAFSNESSNQNIKLLCPANPSPSPVNAINLGIKASAAEFVGVLIDGARIASPGLCRHAIQASRLHPCVIVSTPGYHLGPELQNESIHSGYNQEIEDTLLEEINWKENGYRLFDISCFSGSSHKGFYQPISESNAIFMPKALWEEL